MSHKVSLACETELKTIDTDAILPLRHIASGTRKSPKYNRIASSIREMGIIEPIVVFPSKDQSGRYILLDGHIRLDILLQLHAKTVACLISTDDEAFTYNHRVSRLSAIQEHFMILKAIKNGVTEEEIAQTLNIDVSKIRAKRDLLKGVCPEAVKLLKERRIGAESLRQIRKVKSMRQIEMCELMNAAQNHSQDYVKCLVAATPKEQLVDPEEPREVGDLLPKDLARMEREMESLSQDFRAIEKTHSDNVLKLVVAVGYLKKLLDNVRVVRYLASKYPEILYELQKIAESKSLAELPADGCNS